MPNNKSYMQRFMEKVNKTDSCWLWTGTGHAKGYGHFAFNGRVQKAHRVSYQLFKGPIPDGLYVLHKCDTPACVNPDHLWAGTCRENVLDMWSKRRHPTPPPGEKHPGAKLTWEQVREIRRLRAQKVTYAKLAKMFDVTSSTIHKIVFHVNWKEDHELARP